MVNYKIKTIIYLIFIILVSCQNNNQGRNETTNDSLILTTQIKPDSVQEKEKTYLKSEMINVMDSITNAIYDIRYADTNNFVHRKMYPCPACYLRPEAFMALKKVEENANKMGLKLLRYDCFRPLEVQKMLWEIMPNPIYVTPPYVGSQHNRGLAVDLTLADNMGNPIDMGNLYDDFSTKSHWTYKSLSLESFANRNLLKKLMKTQGFDTINSEWWHYSFNRINYPVENEV
jgi:D-alanyl-D-alanine dipeptidase